MGSAFELDWKMTGGLFARSRADLLRDERPVRCVQAFDVEPLVQPNTAFDRAGAIVFRVLEMSDREADHERAKTATGNVANFRQNHFAKSRRSVSAGQGNESHRLLIVFADHFSHV